MVRLLINGRVRCQALEHPNMSLATLHSSSIRLDVVDHVNSAQVQESTKFNDN
jgi:hypothetical protein